MEDSLDTDYDAVKEEAVRVEPALEIPFRNIIKKVNFGPDALNFISDLCRIPLDSSCIDDEPDTYKYKNLSEVLDSISNFTSVL